VVSKSINLDRNVLAFTSTYSGVRYFNSTVGRVPVRQVQVPLINKTGTVEAWLIVAIPTRNVMLVLVELKNIMLISFPVIILLLFILTRAIAGRSIRPVDDVIAIAETMTQASLDQRISLPRKHDELYRLSFTINALLDQLQDAFQREKHFTSDASHELRTPLAVVKGTLDVLIRKPRPVEHYEEKIRYCLDELNRMARLIDQLLILARYDQESIKPKTAPIEISSVVESVIARMEQMAGEKQISFVRGNFDPGMVSADLAMLEMIFENIFTNAIKFSHAGSSIEIEVARRTALMVCTITDHGVGIPEEKLQHVFDRFYRVDESRGSSTGGFGLGLSIVRKLADLQQIGVSVTSRENEGTAFRLVFQVA
jgi:heavy metal sensor kinase